jgi:hypothetical protein
MTLYANSYRNQVREIASSARGGLAMTWCGARCTVPLRVGADAPTYPGEWQPLRQAQGERMLIPPPHSPRLYPLTISYS